MRTSAQSWPRAVGTQGAATPWAPAGVAPVTRRSSAIWRSAATRWSTARRWSTGTRWSTATPWSAAQDGTPAPEPVGGRARGTGDQDAAGHQRGNGVGEGAALAGLHTVLDGRDGRGCRGDAGVGARGRV